MFLASITEHDLVLVLIVMAIVVLALFIFGRR